MNFLLIIALLFSQGIMQRGTAVRGTVGGGFLASTVFVGDGDSITVGFPGLTPYTSELTGFTTVYNTAVSNETLATMLANESTNIMPKCSGGRTLVNIWGGTNDFALNNTTAAAVYANLTTYVANAHGWGCRVIVSTMISRSCASPNGMSCDQNKDIYNPLIVTNTAGADGIVNFTPTVLGCDGCYTNMTYFQADAVHPTQTGITTVETPTIQAIASGL